MRTGLPWFLERGLYVFISLQFWVLALVGFWPGYLGPLANGTLEKSTAVHLHVVVYVGWLVLFSVQSTLPMLRKSRLHQRIGRFGIGYGVLLWIVGVWVTFSRFSDRIRLGDFDEARFQALPPSTDMLVFPILFGLAIHFRRQPDLHKRFMVLTGTLVMVAAVARMVINGVIPEDPLLFLAIWLAPVYTAIAHDAWFRRRLHPVYGFGIVALAVVPARMLLIETNAWRAITDWVAQRLVA